MIASETPGLETVLRRNEQWRGSGGPFLDEVRLVLVPDGITARQLLARGELDALMPLAGTVRTKQLEAVAGVTVDRVARGGWSVVLLASVQNLSVEDRRSLFATVDRGAFVGTLLAGEAVPLQGFAGPEDATWSAVGLGDAGSLKGDSVELSGMAEEPMTVLLHRSMQKRAKSAGGTIELRAAEADRVEGWVRDGAYSAAIVPILDPLGNCWRCRWEAVDGALTSAADAGDPAAVTALETKLRDEALVLPLWHPDTVVARRQGLNGPKANGYAASAAWNAWEWWRSA
jgi:ABC-type transport system substrate-binding protein